MTELVLVVLGLELLSLLRTQLQELHSWPFLVFQTLVQMSLSQRDLVKLRQPPYGTTVCWCQLRMAL